MFKSLGWYGGLLIEIGLILIGLNLAAVQLEGGKERSINTLY